MAKRKRDFKAEYARRVAKAEAAGKSRQQARGHKAKEHVKRAERTRRHYGVSPAQLTRLRRLAKERVISVFTKIAKNPISDETVRRGMRILHGEDLQRIVDEEVDDVDIVSAVVIQDAYFYQLGDYFPASIDDIESEGINPLWYHR